MHAALAMSMKFKLKSTRARTALKLVSSKIA